MHKRTENEERNRLKDSVRISAHSCYLVRHHFIETILKNNNERYSKIKHSYWQLNVEFCPPFPLYFVFPLAPEAITPACHHHEIARLCFFSGPAAAVGIFWLVSTKTHIIVVQCCSEHNEFPIFIHVSYNHTACTQTLPYSLPRMHSYMSHCRMSMHGIFEIDNLSNDSSKVDHLEEATKLKRATIAQDR